MLRTGAVFAIAVLLPSGALAAAFEVDARTEAQVSSIRTYNGSDPNNPAILPRRRLVQYLGVDAFELVPDAPLGFESSLRVFADFGLPLGQSSKVDGLKSEDAELLFANVFYKGKEFSFRVGRQIYTDVMGTMAFDGGDFRYVKKLGTSGIGIGAEAYAGLWVKAGSTLGSSVYQPDGIRESDLRRVQLQQTAPYAALDDIEPVVGARVIAENLKGVSASLGFRQAWLSGETDIRRASADAKWLGVAGFSLLGGAEYDMLNMRVANARAQVRMDREVVSVNLEYVRVSPILSADSIWSYFATAPHDGVRARFDVFPRGPFRFYVNLVGDLYSTPINTDPTAFLAEPSYAASWPTPYSYGGGGGASMHVSALRLAADYTLKTGYGGRQMWFDVNGGYVPKGSKVTAEARVSVANLVDSRNALYQGTYVGFQVWGSYLLTRSSRFSVVVEENVGPATKSDTKLFVLYDLKAVL